MSRKPTRQQTAVAEQLASRGDFVSAQQLHAALTASGASVGLATVYRTLQTMTGDGTVDALITPEGETIYRRCETTGHHHHLVCRQCGRTVEVEGPAVEQWADRVSSENGFRDVEHTLEIFGVCAEH